MLMCIQILVKFCPLVLKILSGNENYDGITELQNNRLTELQKDRQGKSSIAPTFSKRGYKYIVEFHVCESLFEHNRVSYGYRNAKAVDNWWAAR